MINYILSKLGISLSRYNVYSDVHKVVTEKEFSLIHLKKAIDKYLSKQKGKEIIADVTFGLVKTRLIVYIDNRVYNVTKIEAMINTPGYKFNPEEQFLVNLYALIKTYYRQISDKTGCSTITFLNK